MDPKSKNPIPNQAKSEGPGADKKSVRFLPDRAKKRFQGFSGQSLRSVEAYLTIPLGLDLLEAQSERKDQTRTLDPEP